MFLCKIGADGNAAVCMVLVMSVLCPTNSIGSGRESLLIAQDKTAKLQLFLVFQGFCGS